MARVMEPIFRTQWGGDHPNPSLGHSNEVSCAWSCTNLLAFTSEKRSKGFFERFIQIVDPNQPWDANSIPYRNGIIKSLQWNQTGTKLLCSDSYGNCIVWMMNNHLLNVWTKKNLFCSDLHGEEILGTAWLHNGKRVIFHTDKFDNVNEKLTRTKFKPSVTQLGGQPLEGYIAVTGTGYVYVKIITPDDEVLNAKASLEFPHHMMMTDIAFSSQGNIAVMASDCDVNSPVNFWTVELKYNDEEGKLKIDVNVLPSITLKCISEPQCKYDVISHIRFVSRENIDHVLICVTGATGSMLESWLAKKEQNPQLHRIFQQMAVNLALEKSTRWQFVTKSQHLQKVMNFTVPSLPISTSSAETKASNDQNFYCGFGIGVALADNTIQVLHRMTLLPITSIHIPETVSKDKVRLGKHKRLERSSRLQHIEFSSTSCALALLDDRASLIIYKVAPWLNPKSPVSDQVAIRHLTHLLHFCVVTGYVWWDVLLHVQSNMAKPVCDLLASEFCKQSVPLQQMLHSRLLSVKLTIYQMVGYPEAIDCHIKLLFEAVTVVFRSLLRSPQDSTDDQAPADRLHEACSTSYETDINKFSQVFDDTDLHTLQSLQQLIQWVADISLYLLSVVPQVNTGMVPGVALLQDKGWLVNLRELLVIIRTWGLLKSACLPVFCCIDDQIDCLSHIFKLVSKVWQVIGPMESGQNLIPDVVVEECCLLSNQILIPSLDVVQPVDGVVQRLNEIPIPYIFSFGEKSSAPSDKFSKYDLIRSSESTGTVDNLRRIFLGVNPVTTMKQCTRCGILSVLNPSYSRLGFWDQRFVRFCVCGGRWRKNDR